MADMNYGFKLAQDSQQWLIEAEAWASDVSLDPKVLQNVQAAHTSLAQAFVQAGFSDAQTAAIFPGAQPQAGGVRPRPEDGGGAGKAPPSKT